MPYGIYHSVEDINKSQLFNIIGSYTARLQLTSISPWQRLNMYEIVVCFSALVKVGSLRTRNPLTC